MTIDAGRGSARSVKDWLDVLLDLPPAARARELETLEAVEPDKAAEVRSLMEAFEGAGEERIVPRRRVTSLGRRQLPEDESRPAVRAIELPRALGHYELVELIGQGGMGSVYRAQQREPIERTVAVKVLRPGPKDCEVLDRFERERQLLSLLDDPGIARILDAGSEHEVGTYIVMELVPGRSVTEHCAEMRSSAEERVRFVVAAARALQHAHGRGVLHRDIKPSNVLVCESDEGPRVKLIDFGVAKALSDDTAVAHETIPGRIVGTLAYMSPEQAGVVDSVPDARSDVYSLALVIHELLTGELPHETSTTNAAGLAALLESLSRDVCPRLERTRLPDLSAAAVDDLGAILSMALRRCPGRRYASADAFANDLERALEGGPVVAQPPTRLYLLSRFARRHQRVVAALAAGLVFLLLAVVSVSYALRQEVQHSAELEESLKDSRGLAEAYSNLLLGVRADRGGRYTTLSQAISSAADAIVADEDMRPALRGQLAASAGEALYDLEQLDRADELLRFAAADLEVALEEGGDRELLMDTLHRLANLTLDRGDIEGARVHYERSRDLARMSLEDGAPASAERALVLEERLASLLDEAGDTTAAIELQRSALERAVEIGSRETLATTRTSLAISLIHAGDFEAAVETARAAYDDRRERLPAGDPGVLNSGRILADALVRSGHMAEAVELARELLSSQGLPVEDPLRLMTEAWAARLEYQVSRERSDADKLAKRAARAQAFFGARSRMGMMLESMRIEAALADPAWDHSGPVAELMELLADRLGSDHMDLTRARISLGRVLLASGRTADARVLLAEARESVAALDSGEPPLLDELDRLIAGSD